jgi:hypothetical protein
MMHLEITPGPQWFSGPDFIIDLVSVVVLLLIGVFAWKFYSLNKSNKKHLFMFTSLAILGASFVFKIITYFILYLTTFKLHVFTVLGQPMYYMEPNNFYFSISFIIYSLLTVLGFYILYTIYEPKTSLSTNILILYLLMIAVVFTENAYIILHLTAMILSVMITYKLWKGYKKNKLSSTKYLAISFGIISLSRIFFIVANSHSSMYVAGEFIQLTGYILLLLTFIMVLQNGKKTRANRYN